MIIAVSGLTEDASGRRGSAGAGKDAVADHLVAKHGFVKVAFADEIKRITMRLWDFTEEQLWGPSEERNKPDDRYPLGYKLECGCIADRYESNDKGRIVEPGWWVANILNLCDDHEEHWHRGHCIRVEPEEYFLTPRHALQMIGTDVARKVDPDVWARYALKVAKQILEEGQGYNRVRGLNRMGWSAGDEPKGVVFSDLRFKNEMSHVEAAGGKNWRKKRKVAILPGHGGKHESETGLLDVLDEKFDGVFPDGNLGHCFLLIDSVMDVYTGRIIPYDAAQADIPPFLRK